MSMKAAFRATGTARMEVIKGPGLSEGGIASITDRAELERIAKSRKIVFSPRTTVERMKQRLQEPAR